jgi:hypothetical protein
MNEKRILVVNDDSTQLNVLSGLLRSPDNAAFKWISCENCNSSGAGG